jgi:hypothetical protein
MQRRASYSAILVSSLFFFAPAFVAASSSDEPAVAERTSGVSTSDQAMRESLAKQFGRLVAMANMKIFGCRMQAGTYLINASMGQIGDLGAVRECTESGARDAESAYKELKKSVGADKDLRDSLNEYMATLLTTFEALVPQSGESDRRYDLRTEQLQLDLSKKAKLVNLQLI